MSSLVVELRRRASRDNRWAISDKIYAKNAVTSDCFLYQQMHDGFNRCIIDAHAAPDDISRSFALLADSRKRHCTPPSVRIAIIRLDYHISQIKWLTSCCLQIAATTARNKIHQSCLLQSHPSTSSNSQLMLPGTTSDLYYTDQSRKIAIPHNLKFYSEHYRKTHTNTLRKPFRDVQATKNPACDWDSSSRQ